MQSFIPSEMPVPKVHQMLMHAVSPRPICFASTIDLEGRPNLSPFSFFNLFGANPPIVVFSPARRGRDNTVKDTFLNVQEVGEVVINIVDYSMVEQMSLASSEFPRGVNEFEKAGFTMLKSDTVRPFRVAESPAQLECVVKQIIETGPNGGAGNLVITEVVKFHFADRVFNDSGAIDPYLFDQVARCGGDWYSRMRDGLFALPKPLTSVGLGVDALPAAVRNSNVLTGNDLGKLGSVEVFPEELVEGWKETLKARPFSSDDEAHQHAKEEIIQNRTDNAFALLVAHHTD